MTKSKAAASSKIPALPKPTEGEVAAMTAAREKRLARPSRVSVHVEVKDGEAKIQNPHDDAPGWSSHLTAAFGSRSGEFAGWGLDRLATATAQKAAVVQGALNGALAIMEAIEPQNELEAAIGLQIIACNAASLDFMARARMNAGEHFSTAAAYAGMATKVSRTMAVHVETLGKLRSGGKQTHEVRYVYVNGPAVIGDHAQAVFSGGEGGVRGAISDQSHAPSAIAGPEAPGGVPMRCEDPARDALPIASGARS